MQTTTPVESCKALVQVSTQGDYELRFCSLFHQGRALSFPCDAQGHVDMDRLSEHSRNNYLYARAVVGREYTCPQVMAVTH